MFYNYIRMIKDLYAIKEQVDKYFYPTLDIMLDECVMHFLQAHSIPFEKQGEFLTVMLHDMPQVATDYKTRKFDMK